MKTRRLGFLGAGNMSHALIKGLLHGEVVGPDRIVASDVKSERLDQLRALHGIRTTQDNHALLADSDVVVLAVKPQVIDKVLTEVGAEVRADQLVVSVAAGVPLEALEARLPRGSRVVRAMPNTPATVQAGATAIARGAHAREDDLRIARALFEAVGRVVVLDESLLDAVTGLSRQRASVRDADHRSARRRRREGRSASRHRARSWPRKPSTARRSCSSRRASIPAASRTW